MNVNLGIKRALVVHHIAHIWDIETSSCYICTHKDSSIVFSITSGLNLSNSSFEFVQILKSLPLLHLGMQWVVFDLQEIEQRRHPKTIP